LCTKLALFTRLYRDADCLRAGRSGDGIPVGRNFPQQSRPALGPPSLLYNGYRVFPGGKVRPDQSKWPRGLRRRFTAARLLRLWVRIPPGAWMSVCYECCVLAGRGLYDELITRPEESYRLWCVVCDRETTKILVNEEEEAKAH